MSKQTPTGKKKPKWGFRSRDAAEYLGRQNMNVSGFQMRKPKFTQHKFKTTLPPYALPPQEGCGMEGKKKNTGGVRKPNISISCLHIKAKKHLSSAGSLFEGKLFSEI
ncbi:hypothetical protein CEXT_83581 [Caerostris extrusa]|uniref:Uncharacterized protein n=1 Tax=Caerostris extrusa TaxID=172846 RepID=A0AAV4PP05_CAEEX|nr:hypothetical protein CEXT_83581 [Caerostris extrusa]